MSKRPVYDELSLDDLEHANGGVVNGVPGYGGTPAYGGTPQYGGPKYYGQPGLQNMQMPNMQMMQQNPMLMFTQLVGGIMQAFGPQSGNYGGFGGINHVGGYNGPSIGSLGNLGMQHSLVTPNGSGPHLPGGGGINPNYASASPGSSGNYGSLDPFADMTPAQEKYVGGQLDQMMAGGGGGGGGGGSGYGGLDPFAGNTPAQDQAMGNALDDMMSGSGSSDV